MLYKYLPPDRLDVLTGGLIRFTQPSALNDPFELQPYFARIGTESDLRARTTADSPLMVAKIRKKWHSLSAIEKQKIPIEIWEKRCRELLASGQGQKMHSKHAAQVAERMNALTPTVRAQLAEGLGRIGLLSLSEVADNALMWAHYAKSHTGFVIGFDQEHQYFSRRRSEGDHFYHLRRVVYRQPRAVDELRDLTLEEVVTSKPPEWSYEREWRMLVPLADADKTVDDPGGAVALFRFPANCVSVIILGSRVLENLEGRLRSVAANPPYEHVDLLRAALDLRTKRIRIEPV